MATVMRISVLTLFRTHTYSFGSKLYQQKAGGPIGLRSTCCIARLVMLWWDEELLQLLVKNNVITEAQARYMDDIRIWLWSIRHGWKWEDGELRYCEAWRAEDRHRGATPLQKSTEVLEGMMNHICSWLTLTMETEDQFGGRLPTLDLNIWVGDDNTVLFTFYEKPMVSNQVIQKESAMPENGKMATLNQELVRRMMNTSEDLELEERILVVDNYCQKLANSGYRKPQITKVVVGGLTGYERRRELSLLDKKDHRHRPLHESRNYNARNRRVNKMLSKQNWFKRKEQDNQHDVTKRTFQEAGWGKEVNTEGTKMHETTEDNSQGEVGDQRACSIRLDGSTTSQEGEDAKGDCSSRLDGRREQRRAENRLRRKKRLERIKEGKGERS